MLFKVSISDISGLLWKTSVMSFRLLIVCTQSRKVDLCVCLWYVFDQCVCACVCISFTAVDSSPELGLNVKRMP